MPESIFVPQGGGGGGAVDWQPNVINTQTTPPGAPAIGDRYIVMPTGTGLWAGQDNDIAQWDGAVWVFETPENGWATYAEIPETIYIFDGAEWNALPVVQNFRQSFVNADLAAGVLTVTHNLGAIRFPVTVSDENDEIIGPDLTTFVNANSLTVDLSTFGVIVGTWNVVVGS